MEEARTPEFYSDTFDYSFNPYGFSITFSLGASRQMQGRASAARDQATVRMSLQQAKVISMLLRKSLSAYERENGIEISIPAQVFDALGVSREDWPDPNGRVP
ncbi:MAG: hypothetical protein HUU14_02140 [Dehalococcoidia bacterium]|nr:hypothetical protein [Chloroflexi bacterium CFX7]MCK6565504.1 hypothetical protein [Dehalococcoidia bacterium]NUQ54669.1 hypothetical protein [Dehalococcoidia bacterium]